MPMKTQLGTLAGAMLLLTPPAMAASAGGTGLKPPVHARAEAVEGTGAEALAVTEAAEEADIEWLETTRGFTHRTVRSVATTIDSWFGDEPFEGRGKVSGRLGMNALWRQDDGTSANVRFRVRMDLPNLKRRTYLFFGQDNERELITDQPESFSRQQQLLRERRHDDQSFFAGLGYALRDSIEFRAGVRGGYKIYAQARYRKQWWLSDRDSLLFRETVFWTVRDNFGSTTALDYEHAYSSSLSFRWGTAATVTRRTDGFDWSSSAGFFKALGDKRLLSLEALVNGATGSSIDVAEYGIRATWRQVLYKDWVVGNLTLGHFWPRDEDDPSRERSWAVGTGVELRF